MATPTHDEAERPAEWLRLLCENRDLYRELFERDGSIAIAAYRLARARCRVREVPSPIPTAAELRVAAIEIAYHVGCCERLDERELIDECEKAGLSVIASRRAA